MDLDLDENRIALGLAAPSLCPVVASPRRSLGRSAKPNYFIGIRLHGLEPQADDLTRRLVCAQPELQHYLTSIKRLHFTCFVLNLSDDDAVHRAAAALGECENDMQLELSGASDPVLFQRISGFPGKVLYLEADANETMLRLHRVTALLKAKFEAAGLYGARQNEMWVPHLTIAKQTKNMKRRLQNEDTFKPEAYHAICSDFFAENPRLTSALTVIELLSMAGNSSATDDVLGVDGYYKSIKSVWIGKNN